MFIKSEVPNADLKTNEGFRSFVQHVRDVLTTVNPSLLTRTADTGQIDPLTANTPLTTSTSNTFKEGGYDIYMFNDSVQPIYFKLIYGAWGRTGAYTSKMEFGLYVEIGTGSDGVGTITTQIFSGWLRKSTYNSTPTTQLSERGVHYTYCCVKDGYLSFHFDVGSLTLSNQNYPNSSLTTESHSLIFSRKDGGHTFLFAVNSSSSANQLSDWSGQSFTNRQRDLRLFLVNFEPGNHWSYVGQLPSWSAYIPGTTGIVGSNIGVKRLELHDNKGVYKDKNLLLYWGDDFGYEQQETVSIDGVDGNFLFLTPALRATYPLMNIAIRWE